MKKLLAKTLTFMISVCMFSACVGTGNKADDTAAVKAVVGDYIELSFSGDKAALDCVKEGSDAYEEAEKVLEQLGGVKNLAQDSGIPEAYVDEVNTLVADFIEKVLNMIDYEVQAAEVDGNKANAAVKINTPDFESMGNVMESIDAETLLFETFTMEELTALSSAEEEEQGKFIVKWMNVIFDAVFEKLEESSVEKTEKYELEKLDEKWTIINID